VVRACSAVLVGTLICLTAGCLGQGEPTGNARYVPSEETARRALDAALSAWAAGQPPGQVSAGPPAVYLIDNHRRPGQTLTAYEVLGPVPGEGPVLLAARLTLASPDPGSEAARGQVRLQEERAQFVIFGIDPLWVYRQEDFEMMIHMDHPSDDGKSPRPAVPPSR
jgi:hypothetical protein